MQLLSFLLQNLLLSFYLPIPSDICRDSESLKESCITITSFSFVYFFAAIILIIYFSVRPRDYFKKLFLIIFSVLALFHFADHSLKELTSPNTWGLDLFIVSYYFWCFLAVTFFVYSLLFSEDINKKYKVFAMFTFVLSVLFGFWGRGTEEMLNPIFGAVFFEKTISSFGVSYTYALMLFIFWFAFIYSLVSLAAEWVINSKSDVKTFFSPYKAALKFLPILFIPMVAYFTGDYVNKNDVEEAKNFISEIKKKTDKYYLENGEYPKLIEEYIDKTKPNPWLLKRHEYFSFDIPGTYYFSRADKYCFIFQNPNSEFGYYSVTSTRDWNYVLDTDSFDDLYLELCGETENSSESLIAGRLGLEGTNDYLGELGIKLNKPFVPAISRSEDRLLHNKIIEYGKTQNPGIFKYYGNAPKKVKEILEHADDVPADEDIK